MKTSKMHYYERLLISAIVPCNSMGFSKAGYVGGCRQGQKIPHQLSSNGPVGISYLTLNSVIKLVLCEQDVPGSHPGVFHCTRNTSPPCPQL